jgi:hypothetical protein
MPAGFLYVLINPTMPGLAKVGKTTRNPTDRVAELSSATGVPSPFMLAFQQPVADCDAAELWVHKELEREGFRHADNREFFNAPLHEIIKTVSQSANIIFDGIDFYDVSMESQNSESDAEILSLELFNFGVAYEEGTDTTLRNPRKALEYYEQAAALGHELSCFKAAEFYKDGRDGVRQDAEKALTFYNKLVSLGVWLMEAKIAGVFLAAEQKSAAQAHWIKFFERAIEAIERAPSESLEFNIGSFGTPYCIAIADGKLVHCVPDETIIRLSECLLKEINDKILEVAQCFTDEELENVTLILEMAEGFVSTLKIYGKFISEGKWWFEAEIAGDLLFRNQRAAAQAHWQKFFESACLAVETNSKESSDHTIGYYGYHYCEQVADGEISHSIPDKTIALLAGKLLAGIENKLTEVAAMSDRKLAKSMSESLYKAQHFVKNRLPAGEEQSPYTLHVQSQKKFSFKDFFR